MVVRDGKLVGPSPPLHARSLNPVGNRSKKGYRKPLGAEPPPAGNPFRVPGVDPADMPSGSFASRYDQEYAFYRGLQRRLARSPRLQRRVARIALWSASAVAAGMILLAVLGLTHVI